VEQVVFRPAKLLVTVVGKNNGHLVLAASKRGGARGGTKAAGRSFLGGGGEEEAEALLTLMLDEADGVVREVLRAGLEDPEHVRGLALVLDAAAMVRPGGGTKNAEGAPERAEGESMNSGNILITCIITHGQADEIMSVARQAGARGGTILNARGTGTEDDVKFFGISLAPEKEMLLIVAQSDQAQALVESVCRLPIFSEPGGGIVFTTPVEEFFYLGR
jgi:nitrogen regulatory protein PII